MTRIMAIVHYTLCFGKINFTQVRFKSTFRKTFSHIFQTLFLQEIYKDRQKFSEQVFKVASSDLVNMGISVVSYTLKDIHDDQVNEREK